MTADSTFAYAFGRVLADMIWAVLATFTCYFGGILLAMFINNKNTRGKKFWRTCFMVAIAVPQFVSLLLVRNFFADAGIVNTLCKNAGLTDWLYSIGAIPTANYIPFLTHPAGPAHDYPHQYLGGRALSDADRHGHFDEHSQ